MLAAKGEIGGMFKGGSRIQFSAAPHTTAANASVAVGRVNKMLVL